MKVKKMILTATAAVVVVMNAQAQTYATIGENLPISSAVDASGSNVTYEWYYLVNGRGDIAAPIPGCNGPQARSCVVLSNITSQFSDGTQVMFYRRAIANDCAIGNSKNTTPITVTFANLVMNGVRWAKYNTTTPSPGSTAVAGNAPVFDTSYNHVNARIFQYNRSTAYDATVAGADPVWDASSPTGDTWDETANPVCPAGWRLPTREEIMELHNNSTPIGGVVSEASPGVIGRFYGVNATTCAANPNGNLAGCVFLPAGAFRHNYMSNVLLGANGWINYRSNTSYVYRVNTGVINVEGNFANADGFSVRCVQ